MLKVIIVLLLPTLFFVEQVSAQTLIAEDNAKISIAISANELTRISVSGDRVTLVRGSANSYQLSNDNSQGAVFIKPIISSAITNKTCPIHKNINKLNSKKICQKKQANTKPLKSFYLFISTEQGRHYVLNLMPSYFKSADILLVKPQESETKAASAWEVSDSYTQILIHLVNDILHQKIPTGYTHIIFKKPKEFTYGQNFNLKLTESYIGAHLSVEVYQITNHSKKKQTLSEKDLYQSGNRAIYLQETRVAPQQTVQLIKVTSHV